MNDDDNNAHDDPSADGSDGGSSTSPRPQPAALESPTSQSIYIHPRREIFEYGLLPIPKLIFTDGVQTLGAVKSKLLAASPSGRIDEEAFAEALQIPIDHAELVIDTLRSVIGGECVDEGPADVYDLMLFLYIQSYKKLLPKTHKDSVAVTDVWPSTSAFDGFLSALSPLQLVRSNSRRFIPSQADEEAHQLSYLQKHMANILILLAELLEGDGEDSLVLTLDRLEHLRLLIQFGGKGSGSIPLSQVAPFFANSDPDMPAAPIPAALVHEWVSQIIVASLEHTAEKISIKENGPHSFADVDVNMADTSTNNTRGQSGSLSFGNNSTYFRSSTFVEGVSKASVIKHRSDIKGDSVKVLNCHDSVIYILAPLRYASVYGCSDATVVVGAIGKAIRVEHCERVQIIAAAKRICIANCRECVFYLGVNQQPLILGDNHKLQVAPYNTFYSQLNEHMNQIGLNASINRWDEPLVLGVVDPHDSLSHPAGVSDVQAESATCLDPDLFTNFLIPDWFESESAQPTKGNPFSLPEIYENSLKKRHVILNDVLQAIRDAPLEETRKKELASALHIHFKDWLYATGNIRQLYCLQSD